MQKKQQENKCRERKNYVFSFNIQIWVFVNLSTEVTNTLKVQTESLEAIASTHDTKTKSDNKIIHESL